MAELKKVWIIVNEDRHLVRAMDSEEKAKAWIAEAMIEEGLVEHGEHGYQYWDMDVE